jgi:transcriptional regulator GlxA family with amidase domain
MWFRKTNKEKIAYEKIKSLQKWLNVNFPEKLSMESMAEYKFKEAEDFLVEEARRWDGNKNR